MRGTTPRRVQPLLSFRVQFRPCTARTSPGESIPRTRCEAEPNATRGRAFGPERTGPAVPEEYVNAMIDILWADDHGNSLQRSISYLQAFALRPTHASRALGDLAAAFLVRAERTQNARDMFAAVEAAERAVGLDSTNAVARFNLALALDRLALDGEAASAWKEYLVLDSRSRWAAEAGVRVRDLEASPAAASLAPDASAAQATAFARRTPQEAQVLGWEHLLGEWGAAIQRGDTLRAKQILQLSGWIGGTLEERQVGDATLADAVRWIRGRSGDPDATRSLARAHQAYAIGRTAYVDMDFEKAARAFDRALAEPAASEPLRGWAQVSRAATTSSLGNGTQAERLLDSLVTSTRARYPALLARIRWFQGTLQLRTRRFADAADAYQDAGEIYTRLGETEHRGAVAYLEFDARSALGDAAGAYTGMYEALTTLRDYRASVWLHNLLYVAAEEVTADGMMHAALRLQNEGVRVAERTPLQFYEGEARLARARLHSLAENTAGALADIAAAHGVIALMKPGVAREWLESELRFSEAESARRTEPERAELRLDSAASFFTRQENPLRLLPILLARADVRLRLGKVGDAEKDLSQGMALLEQEATWHESARLRRVLLDDARAVFERAVMLRVQAGDITEALAYLERGRASFAPVSGGATHPDVAPRGPRGQTALVYSLVGDTLLIWAVRDSDVHLRQVRLDGKRLARTIELALTSLELGNDAAGVRPLLAFLYETLIRPVEPYLGEDDDPVVLITDGVVAGAPFAALHNAASGRYLIQDHPLRFASSLRDAAALPSPSARRADQAVLVADPAFLPREFPGLTRLPGARAEADEIAPRYPGAQVIRDTSAHRAAVLQALQRADVFHFAGHAMFDDWRPERSSLVLAATPVPGGGRLLATDIEQLELRGTRLVVLSACRTWDAPTAGISGFRGLTGAFLAAGAGGVVSSLWRVDDASTKALMSEFHRAYSSSGSAADALRTAQMALMRSPDPALRSPAAWAGFRYAGH